MNKYEIKKTGLDTYTLKYKDKEITFKSDVDTTRKIQSAYPRSQKRMIRELSEDGLTIDDLIKTEIKNGKKYEDHSNEKYLANVYFEEMMSEIFDKLCEEKLGLNSSQLILEMGLDEDEQAKFAEELGGAFVGKLP